jgi:site-specific DNA-adenine methylase
VSTEDFEKFLNNAAHFVYCDPPYITYGHQWYSCEFGLEGLSRLKNALQNKERWCISIDRHPETEKIFGECVRLGIDVKYTAKSSYKSKKEDKTIALSNEIVVFPPPPWFSIAGQPGQPSVAS